MLRLLPPMFLLALACEPTSLPGRTADGGASGDGGQQSSADVGAGFDGGSNGARPDTGPQPPGCEDNDADGYGLGADCLGADCDDNNPWRHPGIVENIPFCDPAVDPDCNPDDLPFCDGLDNNCNDQIDEGCPCPSGSVESCYQADRATLAHGDCRAGHRSCVAGTWGACEGAVEPSNELCNGRDDNCDGRVDENVLNACGVCGSVAEERCNGQDDNCDGQIDEGVLNACGGCGELPEELCGPNNRGDGIDNDCDQAVDEGCLPVQGGGCDGRMAQPCYDGAGHTAGRGPCHGGLRDCINDQWGVCVGQALPEAQEICGNAIDDDCNGMVDDSCGPPACVPEAEICGDAIDNDCDGEVDDGCPGHGCVPANELCDGIDNDCDGIIDNGVANACGLCGDVPAEVCGDGIDNNCNGAADEGCACNPQIACDDEPGSPLGCRVCYTGAQATQDVGQCLGGMQRCGEQWLDECIGQVLPAQEVCDGLDNNCDGNIDEHVLNRCAACGPEPVETCDGVDNDCDGDIDEGVLNACGQCGALPDEICDGIDNDCDGNTDEGVLNACGQCGETPAEVCDGLDNNCNGLIDEGVVNACGLCDQSCYEEPWQGENAWNAGDQEGTEVDPANGVTLGQSSWALPFIWVANSGENTVSKLNTSNGHELGRYRMPNGSGSPSRTAVDLDGNVWVGNRSGGTLVKVAVAEADCIDRNNNGQIDTSRDGNNNTRIDGNELMAAGTDECIVLVVNLPGSVVRAVAIDAENNVWAGMWNSMVYHVVNADTGAVLATVDAGGSPYGAIIDGNNLWSSNRGNGTLSRIDVAARQRTGTWAVPEGNLYGIGVDPEGDVWMGQYSSGTGAQFNPQTQTFQRITLSGYPRGIAITGAGEVFVGLYSANRIGKLNSQTGQVIGQYDVGQTGVIGVALDDQGFVWGVNYSSQSATKMRQNGQVVSHHPVGSSPYTYSDMTGQALRTFTVRNGNWTRRFDTGREAGDAVFHHANWAGDMPQGTTIRLRFRSGLTPAATDGAAFGAWTQLNPAPIVVPMGRYLDVQVGLQSNGRDARPFFRDVTIHWSRL